MSLALTLCAMAKIYAWGQYDWPAPKTASFSAQRQVSGVLMAVLIALCWLALLSTQDAATFAYFQF